MNKGLKMKSVADKLTTAHKDLTHTDEIKVVSHVQREKDEWVLNTLMLDNVSAPFKYKRKKLYKSLKGNRVNITYYSAVEKVAGFEIEVMNVVRVKVS